MRRIVKLVMGGAIAMAVVAGVFAIGTDTYAAKCSCAPDYSPVWCKKGNGYERYDNPCLAACDRATDCVPIPLFPPS